jgi:hypothetical protein
MYPIEKYRFYTHGNEVVAVSSFAGRNVRGTAKCDPRDKFSLDTGKALAAARCNEKIAWKRMQRAKSEMIKAAHEASLAYDKERRMDDYYEDSVLALKEASERITEIISNG